MPDQTLRQVGKCIYCGIVAEDLRDEHILPFGLGGTAVLARATCKNCADITRGFERQVLRQDLLKARTALGIRTRRPENRPKRFPVHLKGKNTTRVLELSASQQPVPVVLPRFAKPFALGGSKQARGIAVEGTDILQIAGPPMAKFVKQFAEEDVESVLVKEWISPVALAKLIAKIAYGHAVASLGLEGIETVFVVPAILGERDDIGHWVGCVPELERLGKGKSYDCMIGVRPDGLILGHVRIAPRPATEYVVVVGLAKT